MRQLHLEDAYKIAVWMKVPLTVCLIRNDERIGRSRVPHKTIADMYNRARRPSPKDFDEIWEIDFEGERIN
jgi:predicted kinase